MVLYRTPGAFLFGSVGFTVLSGYVDEGKLSSVNPLHGSFHSVP